MTDWPVAASAVAPRRRRRRWPWLVVVLGIALVVFLVYPSSGGASFTVNGTITVNDSTGDGLLAPGNNVCSGTGGFSDIQSGAQVTVADQTGAIIATGVLEDGAGNSVTCLFPFTVEHVPIDKKFYQLTVTHRGGVTFTEDQLKAGPQLTLGS